jgi:hypothetical protein
MPQSSPQRGIVNCVLGKSGWRKQLVGRFVQAFHRAARIRQMTH